MKNFFFKAFTAILMILGRCTGANAQTTQSLQWDWNDTSAQTVYVVSRDSLDYSINASSCTHFYVTDNHTSYTVSVAPQTANGSSTDVVQTLYVSLDDYGGTTAVTLTHKACPYSLAVSPSSLSWAWNGTGGKSVTVTANYSWTAALLGPDASAFALSTYSGSAGTTTVTVTPQSSNGGVDSRTAVVRFTLSTGTGIAEVSLLQSADEAMSGLTSGTNYIQAMTFTNAAGTTYTRDVTYYDGLGYEEQALQVAGSPDGKTVVRQTVWDALHRPDSVTYLPYVRSDASAYNLDSGHSLEENHYWYSSNTNGYDDTRPYAVKAYEGSQYGRPTYMQREGDAWNANGGHGTSIAYGFNGSVQGEPAVMRFDWSPVDASHTSPYVTSSGDWVSCGLAMTRTTDEAGAVSDSYTTARGLTVCTRSWSGTNGAGTGGTMAETYYVYDLKDSLALVIQPEGAAALRSLTAANRTITMEDNASNANNSIYTEYCFGYIYDGWGNPVTEHVPGGGTTQRVFDARDRVVLETNSLMCETAPNDTARQYPRYIYTEYDVFDRVVARRMVRSAQPLDTLRSACLQSAGVPASLVAGFSTVCTLYAAQYFPFGAITDALTGFTADTPVAATDVETAHVKGLLKSETFYPAANADGTAPDASGGSAGITRTKRYYYDYRGRTVQVQETDSDGWTARYSTKFDFCGNVLATKETHTSPLNETHCLQTWNEYDTRGRLTDSGRELDGNALRPVYYTYDELGRLSRKEIGDGPDNIGNIAFDYDLHGWTTDIAATNNWGQDQIFAETLRYAAPSKSGSTARFDGNISEISFNTDTYAYTYDGLKRLTDAAHYTGSATTPDNVKTERWMAYDRNGNMTGITRYDASGVGSTHSFSHTGNRLAGSNYGYDVLGNMTQDAQKGLQFSYNLANLPCKVEGMAGSANAGLTLSYGYLADGTKTSSVTNQGEGLKYRGSFVYEIGGTTEQLSSIAWSEGRVALEYGIGGTIPEIRDEWHICDHLGNTRVVVDMTNWGTVVEQNEYLPFGTRIANPVSELTTNRYRLASKEEQRFGIGAGTLDLHLSDFGARYYDPVTCRWTTRDPLAGKYHSWSPYNYCAGNPINNVDYCGKVIIPWGLQYKALANHLQSHGNGSIQKEAGYSMLHPLRAFAIGYARDGGHNISSTASNFSINISNAASLPHGFEGDHGNALRHTAWQALITVAFDTETASSIASVHEEDPSETISPYYTSLSEADTAVDLRNNAIGRIIGSYSGNIKDAMKSVLTYFYKEGLWTVEKDKGKYYVVKTKLTKDQYNLALKELDNLNDY